MTPRIVLQDFRPDEIILAYWREQIVIEENAELMRVEYLIEAA